MCKFCEQGKPIESNRKDMNASARIVWVKGKWRLLTRVASYGSVTDAMVDIVYCPVCGRKMVSE